MTNLEIADALERAAQYIVEHGHVKHVLQDTDGRVCAGGALMMVTNGTYWSFQSYKAYECADALAEEFEAKEWLRGDNWKKMVDWNNAPERTQEEVVDHFLLTAAKLRAKEKKAKVPEMEMIA